jgi:hypothetical protein
VMGNLHLTTGAMRIGSDAVVFTKGKETCSLGFLSKSYNQGLDVLEVPIVTYQVSDDGSTLDLDDKHFSRAQEEACKKAVKEHSPFRSDIMIGAQFAKIGARGTSIYVYNLEQWEGKCIFDWTNGAEQEDRNKNDGEIADIQIRSKRVRNRPGQTSRKVGDSIQKFSISMSGLQSHRLKSWSSCNCSQSFW